MFDAPFDGGGVDAQPGGFNSFNPTTIDNERTAIVAPRKTATDKTDTETEVELRRCREGFRGVYGRISQGAVYPATDPVVKKYPVFFETLDAHGSIRTTAAALPAQPTDPGPAK